MTRSGSVLILVLLLLATSACSSSGQADQAGQELDGNEYWSTSVTQNGEPFQLVDGTRITLRFTDGVLQASAGCNSIGGEFDVHDGKLQTIELSTTAMGCDPERHAQDDLLITVLTDAPTITVDGNTLRLATSDTSIEFVDAAVANPDLPVQGTTWEINGFQSGGTARAIATRTPATVRIENGTLQLFDSCATSTLAIDMNDTEIRFEPIEMPAVDGCEAPVDYRESIFTALSQGSLEYSVDGDTLKLSMPDIVVYAEKAAEEP